jgi:hypothetical protein
MGERAAQRYFLTAERFSAQQAQRIGFVHEAVAADALDAAADEIVKALVPDASAGLNLSVLDGGSPREVAADLVTMPLFPGPKVVLTRDPEFVAHGRGALFTRGDTPGREGRDAREENALREEIGRAVAAANSAVSRSESIRAFRILPQPFDQANGLLTPSMKLRRDSIVAHYATEIEAMYQARARLPRQSAPEEVLSWDDADDVFR